MFSQGEADALVAAARLAQAWLDPAMALQMEGALGKILSVLPPAARAAAESQALYAPGPGMDDRTQALLMPLREAVQARRIACIDYADEQGRASARRIRPLGCFFWGKVWTVAAWCELRQDFRGFRIDRIAALRVLDERFPAAGPDAGRPAAAGPGPGLRESGTPGGTADSSGALSLTA